jgi:hypothetical protein
MKLFARILSFVVLFSATLLFMNCGGGGGEGKTAEEEQLDKLKAGPWTIVSADLDGADRTADFTGLTLTVSGTFGAAEYGYSFTGSRPNPSPWPSSGQWKFGADPKTQLIRLDDDPDLAMNYTLTNSDAQLTITFTYSGAGFAGGRTEAVEGDWEFVFEK